ncbi:MAG: DUF2318 domain-containing protein [Oscillospiraceae bacterium]|nr:DUF2318 domain-containing protein [Oscillospiraceae bacterium]
MRTKTLLIALALALTLAACATVPATPSASADTGAVADTPAPLGGTLDTAGGDLIIPVAEVSETVRFYPVQVDGVEMEVLAVKTADGVLRTAFNTCEICYTSGRGYYKQSGNVLVCQNCGSQFPMNQIEVTSNGCNPWPIFPENKTVTADTVTISYDFLKASQQVFANWKN